jgi:hypothetical protein
MSPINMSRGSRTSNTSNITFIVTLAVRHAGACRAAASVEIAAYVKASFARTRLQAPFVRLGRAAYDAVVGCNDSRVPS